MDSGNQWRATGIKRVIRGPNQVPFLIQNVKKY